MFVRESDPICYVGFSNRDTIVDAEVLVKDFPSRCKIKRLTMNTIKRYTTIVALIFVALTTIAQNIPDKPSPFRFVNDYAGVMTESFRGRLEEQLVKLHFSTTNQIAVVTVGTFDGLPASLYATMLGQKWGIGQQGKDNGVVILVKPKTANQKGEAFIATGYGLESILTDAICARIVNEGMISYFKKEDYCGGIHAGVACILTVINGGSLADALNQDYSAVERVSEADEEDSAFGIIAQIFKAIFLGLFFLYMPFWVLGLLFNLFWAIVEKDWTKFSSFKNVVGMGCWLFSSSAFGRTGGNSSGYRGYGGTYGGGYGGGYGSGGGSFGGGGGGGSW